MECNKEEARRVMDIAERHLSEYDYVGAKRFANKAHNLYPNLDGLDQVLMMIDVYISASNGGEETDWYGVLGVDPLADDKTVKKQYKKLALALHPDKNKFHGAEEAFKLVSEAWSLLSDEAKRLAYDEKRKPKEAVLSKPATSDGNQRVDPNASEMHTPPNTHEPTSSSWHQSGTNQRRGSRRYDNRRKNVSGTSRRCSNMWRYASEMHTEPNPHEPDFFDGNRRGKHRRHGSKRYENT